MRNLVTLSGHVQYLVLDEADKMLDLGLQPQLDRIKALVLPHKVSRKKAAATGQRHVQVGGTWTACGCKLLQFYILVRAMYAAPESVLSGCESYAPFDVVMEC